MSEIEVAFFLLDALRELRLAIWTDGAYGAWLDTSLAWGECGFMGRIVGLHNQSDWKALGTRRSQLCFC